MQTRSFDELAREWGTQTKAFFSLLGDLPSQRLKEKITLIVGDSIYGALAVVFGFFLFGWLLVAGYQELIVLNFTPVVSALFIGGGCLALSLLSFVVLKLNIFQVQHQATDHTETLSEAGRDLLTLSKDVAKSALTPKVILKEHAGNVVAASLVFGFLVGMAVERSTPGAKR